MVLKVCKIEISWAEKKNRSKLLEKFAQNIKTNPKYYAIMISERQSALFFL